jgi:hypothetical protein
VAEKKIKQIAYNVEALAMAGNSSTKFQNKYK